jgi:hypothetical protein
VLIWNPTRRVFHPVLPILQVDEVSFPRNIDNIGPLFKELKADPGALQKILRLAVPVVTLFFEYWDPVTSTLVIQGRASGCAVGPRHVITLANFPGGSIPDRVLVVHQLVCRPPCPTCPTCPPCPPCPPCRLCPPVNTTEFLHTKKEQLLVVLW